MNNSSAAAALLRAGLRRGDPLVCCGRCGHSRDGGGTVLVRCTLYKQLVRREQTCDRFQQGRTGSRH